jgi:hypothetical protein
MAARKVIEENKKLRALLAENGVANDSIEKFLHSESTTEPDPLLDAQFGTPANVGAIYRVENLLYPRIQDYGYQSAGVPTTIVESSSNNRDQIEQSLWELTRLTQTERIRRQYEDEYTMMQAASSSSSSQQFATPRSTGTRAKSKLPIRGSGHGSQQPGLGRAILFGNDIAVSKLSRGEPQMFDFDAPLDQPWQPNYGAHGETNAYALATDTHGVDPDLEYLADEDTVVRERPDAQ